jgi:hypothetical protein
MNRQDVIDLIQKNNKEIAKNLFDRADAETAKGNREAGEAIRQVASELAWYRVEG